MPFLKLNFAVLSSAVGYDGIAATSSATHSEQRFCRLFARSSEISLKSFLIEITMRRSYEFHTHRAELASINLLGKPSEPESTHDFF